MNWYKLADLGIYGYWLTPEGKLISVGYQEHAKYLRLKTDFEANDKNPISMVEQALDTGWIRIVVENQIEVDMNKLPNDVQKRVLNKLYRDAEASLGGSLQMNAIIAIGKTILRPKNLREFMVALNSGAINNVGEYSLYSQNNRLLI